MLPERLPGHLASLYRLRSRPQADEWPMRLSTFRVTIKMLRSSEEEIMARELALGVITGLGTNALAALNYVRSLGVPTAQISYPVAVDSEAGIREIEVARLATGIEITTVFCSFAGESYFDIPTVQATVGLVPQATRAERVERTLKIAEFAQKIGVKRVATHIGFVPEDHSGPLYVTMVQVTRRICDALRASGQVFALETGQETAQSLKHFIQHVHRDNLKVNFDPANMILYGNEQPIPALDVLIPWIDGVHCKDGRWPTQEGQLGKETPLGEGDVNLRAWLKRLLELGYRGPLTIEREISGERQKEDILRAVALLEGLRRDFGH
jgi:sugar phosphate isomerase/epimerase